MLIHEKTMHQEENGPNLAIWKCEKKEKDLTRYNEKEKIEKENSAQ